MASNSILRHEAVQNFNTGIQVKDPSTSTHRKVHGDAEYSTLLPSSQRSAEITKTNHTTNDKKRNTERSNKQQRLKHHKIYQQDQRIVQDVFANDFQIVLHSEINGRRKSRRGKCY